MSTRAFFRIIYPSQISWGKVGLTGWMSGQISSSPAKFCQVGVDQDRQASRSMHRMSG